MNDNEGIVYTVAIICAILALLLLSSCQKDMYKNSRMSRNYIACLEAQKGTPVDLDCGNVKEIK